MRTPHINSIYTFDGNYYRYQDLLFAWKDNLSKNVAILLIL